MLLDCLFVSTIYILSSQFFESLYNFVKLSFSVFLFSPKKPCCLFFFLLEMFYIYFSCFVLFFCFLKKGLQFSHFLLACCDVSEKMLFFVQQIGEDIFCFFSFCHFFFCSLVCLFLKRVCEINLFILELFFEIPCSSFFSLHFFVTKKKSTQKKSSLFFQSFLVSLFSFNIFPCFFHYFSL